MKSSEIISNIPKIYKRYKTPRNLILHMLRVSAVAEKIYSNWNDSEIKKEDILASCLLHDLGNIVKMGNNIPSGNSDFDDPILDSFEFQEIKKDFISKYGEDDDIANHLIAREIGVNSNVLFIIENMSTSIFPNFRFQPGNWELKICKYSDLRVAPSGIMSVEDRLIEASKRYDFDLEKEIFYSRNLEKDIFSNVSISPSFITPVSCQSFISKYIKELKLY